MIVAVVGLGRIGMPLAVQFAEYVDQVIGVDVNEAVVEKVVKGEEPFPGEAELANRLRIAVESHRLTATTSHTEAVRNADVVVVVVPLVIDGEGNPDFSLIDDASESIGRALKGGSLVSYETTVPVGTTRSRFVPILERASGMTAGKDFKVVFSPERVLTGRVFSDLRRYPKLVGGVDPLSESSGVHFYQAALEFDERPDLPQPNGVWRMGSCEAAEMAKLVETTYRDVNIALANEFALFAQRHQVDFQMVTQACNSQPFSHVHRPGIAVGGHCIPVYPHLYMFSDPLAAVVRTARDVNESLPARWLAALESEVGPLAGKRVAVLGAGFRANVRETAFSGLYPVVEALERKGATVRVHDALLSDEQISSLGFEPFAKGSTADVVVVQADHDAYASWSSSDVPEASSVLDGRGVLDRRRWPKVTFVSVMGESFT